MDRGLVSFLPVDHWHGTHTDSALSPEMLSKSLGEMFGTRSAMIAPSGRAALDAWMAMNRFRREHEVWITTTFDLPNVSSCVTCTVFNHCKPSRVLTDATRAIFVIHEFGVPHPALRDLAHIARARGIPLIEDCAHTIDSAADGTCVGRVGDWVLLSFPKIFPVTGGGAILGRHEAAPPDTVSDEVSEIQRDVSLHLPHLAQYSARRREVFSRIASTAVSAGYTPLFSPGPSIAPWFVPIRTPHCSELIRAMHAARIDAANWHGSDVVVLPCHQFLGDEELSRIEIVLRDVAENQS